jgi:endonuclease YncB( thermonuclease family)
MRDGIGGAAVKAIGRARLLLGCAAIAAAAGGAVALAADGPAPSPVGAAPTVEEWLNQPVRLRDTAEARDRPAADGKPAGEIRAGAEVKAIGLVAGKSWVEIELPDHAIAYLPRAAIEYESSGAAATAPAPPPSTNPPTTPAAAAPPSGPAGTIRGTVSKVPNAATLVVADQRIRLSGIDPGPQAVLAPFEKWVEAQGALDCEPEAQTDRYRCLTGGGVDVAQAAILNGSGRVGDGAPPAYRDSETQARNAGRGLWGQP